MYFLFQAVVDTMEEVAHLAQLAIVNAVTVSSWIVLLDELSEL